jgi:hypothetical protein
MGRMKLPRAILFDLDDTILVAFGPARRRGDRLCDPGSDEQHVDRAAVETLAQRADAGLVGDVCGFLFEAGGETCPQGV